MSSRHCNTSPRSRFLLGGLALFAIAFAAAGCTPLLESDQPASSTWWLKPTTLDLAGITGEPRRLSLSVTVIPGLDSDRILTLDPDAQLNHIAGAHWADHLPELLTSLVTRSLEGAPRFPVISRHGYRRTGECLLAIEAREFQVQLDGENVARSVSIDFAGLYRCENDRRTMTMTASAPVSANRLPAIVGAFQAAFDDSMRQLAGELAGEPAGNPS